MHDFSHRCQTTLQERVSSVATARTEVRIAPADAASPEARRPAKDVFEAASVAETAAYDTAVADLGSHPVVPGRRHGVRLASQALRNDRTPDLMTAKVA